MTSNGQTTYLIEGFVIDSARGLITQDGKELYLRPQTMKVLAYLIQQRDRPVSKDELLATLWKDTTVTEDVLVQCIMELRKVLRDDSHRPQFIRTLPKRGYRFIGKVEEQHICNTPEPAAHLEEEIISVEYEYAGKQTSREALIEKLKGSPLLYSTSLPLPVKQSPGWKASRRLWISAIAAILILGVGFGGWFYLYPGPPATALVRGSTIEVKDRQGRLCWRKELPSLSPVPRWIGRSSAEDRFVIEDIDWDGRIEVVFNFIPKQQSGARARLICFEEDGRQRWEFPLGRSISYGGRYFDEQYLGRMLRLVRNMRRSYLLAISTHEIWYPSQVALLDPSTGSLVEEYWHPGSLSHCLLQDLDKDGVQEILLAGLNNPGLGMGRAALLVLKVPFSSVAAKNEGPFAGFTGGREFAYFLFPRPDTTFVENFIEPVDRFEIRPPDRIVLQLGVTDKGPGSIVYVFDFALRLVEFRISDGMLPIHDRLEHDGVLDHPLSEKEIACLGVVRPFSTAPDGNSPALYDYWSDCEHGKTRALK